jgi:hypothetical protein
MLPNRLSNGPIQDMMPDEVAACISLGVLTAQGCCTASLTWQLQDRF